jgi:predicted RNA binding protein YcfA (HicA-like mRNA interferase family)
MAFSEGKRTRGSHQPFTREVNGVKHTTVVPRDKDRIPTGTLKSILALGGIDEQEFRNNLK